MNALHRRDFAKDLALVAVSQALALPSLWEWVFALISGWSRIRTYADGNGVWKPYIVPVKGRVDASGKLMDLNGDGKVDLRDTATQPPTSLVADAHTQGLFVHVFTFRDEKRQLALSYQGNPQAEYLQFYRLGADGLFSEFPDTALKARRTFLREKGAGASN